MRYAMVINADRCTGCDSCIVACKWENELPLGVYRNRVPSIGPSGTWPHMESYWRNVMCQQCENPGCIEVCPTGASYRDEATGIVLVNEEDCIGCEACLSGCPFGCRMINPATNTIQKCTLCIHRMNEEQGWVPACAHNCCTGALTFGDLDDPESAAAKLVAEAGENAHHLNDPDGLGPSAVYILSHAQWQEDPEEVTRLGY